MISIKRLDAPVELGTVAVGVLIVPIDEPDTIMMVVQDGDGIEEERKRNSITAVPLSSPDIDEVGMLRALRPSQLVRVYKQAGILTIQPSNPHLGAS